MKKYVFLLVFFLINNSSFSNVGSGNNFFIVAKDGRGDFTSIQSALDNVPANHPGFFNIYVREGNYNEKIFVEKSNLIIYGENRGKTIIEFAELRKNWNKDHNDDYGSAVVNIKENMTDLIFKSLTIINYYGKLYDDHDHAFAIRGFEGVTRIILDDCSIISYGGDTVSLWNTSDGMYYLTNCHFEGWVDYVCPRGYCLIENSTFYGHNLTASIWHDGSKNEDQKFVIKNSRFEGVKGFPLGRFHRDAQFYLVDCTFSANMADKNIFFAPSNPPRTLQWGESRIYFSNCKVDGEDYEWLKNNLDKSKKHISKNDITAVWVFNNKWDPNEVLENVNKEFKKIQ